MLWHMLKRNVSLFRNGRNQAVRIPRELELPGQDALMYRDGDRLIIEPRTKPALSTLLASWEPLETDWPTIPDAPPDAIELP